MENKQLKKLFLIDGFGAIISALLLGIVLVNLESYFGIPKPTLYFLAALPCVFAVYDFYCYMRIDKNLSKYLRIIAIVNLLYCCLSLALAFVHFDVLTTLGWIYIVGEISIVAALAIFELKTANAYSKLN